MKSLDQKSQEYLRATGGSPSRSVKSKMYGIGKTQSSVRADRTASAAALPERIGADAKEVQLVPQIAQLEAGTGRPINNMGRTYLTSTIA